jgi:stage III sporulation protein SpoIIIAA
MINGPLKIVIMGPPGSGKTQLVRAIAKFIDEANGLSGPHVSIYDGEIIEPSNSAVAIDVMTVQCTTEQFANPAGLVSAYQARGGKL